ncbi:MAG: hypothetical protein JST16_03035 [Bdellovibrionales bacterium]|nr:hypothetical protein [Bdellovibrionales bacterium]
MKSKVFYMALAFAALGAEKIRGGGVGKQERGGSGTFRVAGHGTNGVMSTGGTVGRGLRSGGTQGLSEGGSTNSLT